ncbi:DDE Tnp4 domain-containing protein [Trichonephila clavipes]|nr:DDE Tnp4 domain-containing protein [Trichonephila clavipes]
MSGFLKKQVHLSEDSNETRLVSSICWVVEATNGQLKNWRALNNVIPNVQIPYIGDYVEIVCAIIIAFHSTRLNNIEDNNVITQRKLGLVKKPNYLQQTAEEDGWARKRRIWTLLSCSDLPDFPQSTLKELRYLTLGIYQLKKSSQTHEHLNKSGVYSLYVNQEDSLVVRLQLGSRYTSSKVYNICIRTFIVYISNIE